MRVGSSPPDAMAATPSQGEATSMDPLQHRLNTIVRKVKGYHPNPDIEKLYQAYEFAAAHHEGQMRKSGEPYIGHPVEVMDIIADLRLDVASLCAGLLHDTVEDTDDDRRDLREPFGKDVAFLVDGVTKLSKIPVQYARGASGGEYPQDDHRDVQGPARHPGEAGRPAPQYAHAQVHAAPQAGAYRPGDDGHLRAAGASARHPAG